MKKFVIKYATILINTMLFSLMNKESGIKGMLILMLGELIMMAAFYMFYSDKE